MGAFEEIGAVPEWEYRKIDLSQLPRKTEDIDVLNDAGREGWELILISANYVAYLKRRLGEVSEETADEEASAAIGYQVKVKYRDPATGDTWSGRGRMATWLKRKQDAGEDIEKYRV
jgi:DNA-binding protein H-NS